VEVKCVGETNWNRSQKNRKNMIVFLLPDGPGVDVWLSVETSVKTLPQ